MLIDIGTYFFRGLTRPHLFVFCWCEWDGAFAEALELSDLADLELSVRPRASGFFGAAAADLDVEAAAFGAAAFGAAAFGAAAAACLPMIGVQSNLGTYIAASV